MLRIGPVTLKTNLLLAPIAGYCDLAFRLVARGIPGVRCRELDAGTTRDVGDGTYGAVGLACTDLLCPQAVLSENDKSLWLAATCAEDQPLCMQLYGADPDILAEAARWAQGHGATVIDINMGCPVDKVTKKNGGSKLLCDPRKTVELAKKVVDAVRVPVTAKIRLGWDERTIITDTLPPALADVGIAAITVHGRTTEQMFRGQARWRSSSEAEAHGLGDGTSGRTSGGTSGGGGASGGGRDCIAAVVEAVARHHPEVPVIGNGDVKCAADAARMIAQTGCAGVMIGRGALGQPWIFRDAAHLLATGREAPPLPRWERARWVLAHFEHLLRLRDERYALNQMRSRMSWYSPHLQPWPHLKRDVQALTDGQSFRDFMGEGLARLQREGEAVVV
jgi:tRNA-dihydrouridine synthase